jgi:outer membrane protein assembly factor BamB
MHLIRRSASAVIAALVLFGLSAGDAAAATVPGCGGAASGGDWPSYGGTIDNHRGQTAETTITKQNVNTLDLAWKLPMRDGGTINSTPVVADGCVFTASNLGTVVAANADTGQVVWERTLAGAGGISLAGSGIVGAPAVADGLVYIGMTATEAALVVALDEVTGAIVWQRAIDTDAGVGIDSSPVPFNGMVFQGFHGDESSNHSNPGWAILDGASGEVLAKGHTIPPADYASGDRGGSIVDTPAIDAERGFVYAGTGNPSSPNQNPRTNALLKIDARPDSPTFGEVLASQRGTSDSYPSPEDIDTPICQNELQWPVGRITCAQFDFNFLSSPNIYTDSSGRDVMVEMQKSGVVLAVDRATMKPLWRATIGAPCLACNLGSSAVDDDGIYFPTSGGNLYSLDRDTGAIQWVTPLTGVTKFNAVSVANGIVFNLNDLGLLQVFDAANGVPLLTRMMDTTQPTYDAGNSSGISIARGTVFATSQNGSGSTLFAYRLAQ